VNSATRHGEINLVDPDTGTIVDGNISAFTNEDILAGRLCYSHDDSENNGDAFSFSIMAIGVVKKRNGGGGGDVAAGDKVGISISRG